MRLNTFNKDLKFVKSDWTDNKLNDKGLYTNLYGDDIKSFGDVWRWMRGAKPLAKLKRNQQSPLHWEAIEAIDDKSQHAIIPIGHASFIIDTNRLRLLI